MEQEKKLKAYKGFDKNLRFRGYQYEIGKDYECESEIECCKNGFHACENPLDVLQYYEPAFSRYCEVEQSGEISEDYRGGDSKKASSKIHINAEIGLKGLVKDGINFILNKVKRQGNTESKTGSRSVVTNVGRYSEAINYGDRAVAVNVGDYSISTNIGYYSVAVSTGYNSVAFNRGYNSVATNTGDYSVAINWGYNSAATNMGNRSVAINTTRHSIAINIGFRSVAVSNASDSTVINTGEASESVSIGDLSVAVNTGDYSDASVEGMDSIAITTGYRGMVKGALGCWIVAAERNSYEHILAVKAAKVDGEKIKADTYYRLVDGEFVEAE